MGWGDGKGRVKRGKSYGRKAMKFIEFMARKNDSSDFLVCALRNVILKAEEDWKWEIY
jgi:hypothetical protein